MGATSEGDIVQLDQARGINKALMKMVDAIVNDAQHVENKTLAISHCNCPERAEMVKEALLERLRYRMSSYSIPRASAVCMQMTAELSLHYNFSLPFLLKM